MTLKGGEVGPSCSHVEPLHSHSTEGQVLENDPSFVSQSVPLRQSLLTATQRARSPQNVKKPQTDLIVNDMVMVYFSFVCLLKLIFVQ